MIRFKFMLTAAVAGMLFYGGVATSPSFAQTVAAADQAEPKALAAAVTAFVDAWNAHDANALGRVFTPDGDFVGIAGRLWHGPAEIARVHGEQFAGRYDKSVFAVDGAPAVVQIRPGVALVHWRWTISGVRDAKGTPIAPYSGIFTWVVVDQDGVWRVRAAQNNVTQ